MFINFKSLSIEFNVKNGTVTFYITGADGLNHPFISGQLRLETVAGTDVPFGSFGKAETLPIPVGQTTFAAFKTITFKERADGAEAVLKFTVSKNSLAVECRSETLTAVFEGDINWGTDPVAARTREGNEQGVSPVSGPAFGLLDNALFARYEDRLLEFVSREGWRIRYDYRNILFTFSTVLKPVATFKVHCNWMEGQYQIPFEAIDKSHGFATPPVGWMTWYAVKFDANEKTVLHNSRRMKELFGKYSDKLVVWVDWEWCHRDFSGNTDTDTFTPRKDAYPHGLDYLAKEISAMGLIPALWCAPCQDARQNRLMTQHPDWVLGKWRELWYVDPSHPEVAKKYIPAAFHQFLKWGYKAFKWDFLYHFRYAVEDLQEQKYDKTISLLSTFHRLTKAARETVGREIFMLFCAIESDHDLAYTLGLFNAARIGGDVFNWKEFTTNVCQRILRYYPYHNTSFYADGDSIILRKEFNTESQARSRVSLYGLTGLPVTIGDNLNVLDNYRIDLLRRIMPVVNMTSRDLQPQKFKKGRFLIRTAISRPFGEWMVVGLLNLKRHVADTELHFAENLGLGTGHYAVFDYWQEKFLGIYEDKICFITQPLDTSVLRITPVSNIPAVISSSRHITQGGYELEDINWKTGTLSGRVKCVGGEPLRLAVMIPPEIRYISGKSSVPFKVKKEKQLLTLTLTAPENVSATWSLFFKPNKKTAVS
ncbi:MAG: alpha-galactosidase [Victivallales bacterium]